MRCCIHGLALLVLTAAGCDDYLFQPAWVNESDASWEDDDAPSNEAYDFSPDEGERFPRGFFSRSRRRVDPGRWAEAASLAQFTGVQRLAVSTDGALLATWHRYFVPALKVWDLAADRAVATLPPDSIPSGALRDMAFSPDKRLLAMTHVGRSGAQFSIWNIETGQWVCRRRVPARHRDFGRCAFSADGRYVICRAGGKLVILDWERDELAWLSGRDIAPELEDRAIVAFACSPTQDLIAIGLEGGPMQVRRLAALGETPLLDINDVAGNLAFSGDGQTLALATGGFVCAWRTRDWRFLGMLDEEGINSDYYVRFAVSRDGRFLVGAAMGFDATGLQICNLATARLVDLSRSLAHLRGKEVKDLVLLPDGRMIVAFDRGPVRFLNLAELDAAGRRSTTPPTPAPRGIQLPGSAENF
jgi:WD40 repeat protein